MPGKLRENQCVSRSMECGMLLLEERKIERIGRVFSLFSFVRDDDDIIDAHI